MVCDKVNKIILRVSPLFKIIKFQLFLIKPIWYENMIWIVNIVFKVALQSKIKLTYPTRRMDPSKPILVPKNSIRTFGMANLAPKNF